jgi:hypothetical protein
MSPDSLKIPKDSLDKLLVAYKKAFAAPLPETLDWSVFSTILLMITLSGLLGGFINYHYSKSNKVTEDDSPSLKNSIFMGLGAALLVPVFLAITQSDIFDGLLRNNVKDHILFISFCVLAGISSTRFISSISDTILKKVDEAKEKANEAEKIATTAEEKADAVATAAKQMNSFPKQIDKKSLPGEEHFTYKSSDNFDDPDLDHNKGQFGGSREADGFIISVDPRPVKGLKDWYKLIYTVKAKDSDKKLTGGVKFYLHNTFKPRVEVVDSVNGVARLEKIAWGAFTIGAEILSTGTKLELDLGDEPGLPDDFKRR